MAHKPISPTFYGAVYVVLVSLTGLTVALSAYAHLGRWEIVAALSIATVKTVLVGLIFMHLIHTGKLTWLILGAALLFLVIMIVGTLHDYLTRPWMPVREAPAGKVAPYR